MMVFVNNYSQTMEQAFAYYTETQLATLIGMESRKSTSDSSLRRQQRIVDGMVDVVKQTGLSADDARTLKLPRLAKFLEIRI